MYTCAGFCRGPYGTFNAFHNQVNRAPCLVRNGKRIWHYGNSASCGAYACIACSAKVRFNARNWDPDLKNFSPTLRQVKDPLALAMMAILTSARKMATAEVGVCIL